MNVNFFTYLGVAAAAYLLVFPFGDWLEWGKR